MDTDLSTTDALELRTNSVSGYITIRKDAVWSVECTDYNGRNLACIVNGIETKAGYDFVINALGWSILEVP